MLKDFLKKSDKAILSAVGEVKKSSIFKSVSFIVEDTYNKVSSGEIDLVDKAKTKIVEVGSSLNNSKNRTFTVATIATGIVAPIPTLIATGVLAVIANSKSKDSDNIVEDISDELSEVVKDLDEVPEFATVDSDLIFIKINIAEQTFEGYFKTGEYKNVQLKDIPQETLDIICEHCPDIETKSLLVEVSKILKNNEK
jgi:hypothetical protein